MSSGKSKSIEFRLVLKESALKELRSLEGDQRKKCLAQLVKIRDNPLVGERLGHRAGIDLTGYRKIYVDRKTLRIVWTIEGDTIVVVMAIA